MDSQASVEGFLVDLVDDAWRADKLPEDDINVPIHELPDPEADTGKHCADPTCKQLDYLPLKCVCGNCFCSDHFQIHTEQCSTATNTKEKGLKKIENAYHCSFPNCNVTSIVPLICEMCKQHFCVPHRHIVSCNSSSTSKKENENVASSVQQFRDAKLIVDKQLDVNISQAKKKGKSELANKIQLMRLKNKASGLKSIPIEERVYFTVLFSSQESVESLPLFVSKAWTVGKILDIFAQQFNIQNNNNKSGALKLRLFREADGSVVSKSTSDKLETLLKNNVLNNGELLRFSFVKDDCTVLKVNK